ncbi:hypothetical protein HPB50_001707 [Hyalomma asiaticum]|uniref:Uncharacterized protein n=1 Tax=Hyalomma asiaticum TaxID=266040 RepID=A0ACB7SY31_HYAAI|nr:hypothetical protein HPB50_001707 [Hyalomma asiaticum]
MAGAEKTMRPFAARGRGHGLRANAVHTAVAPLRARAQAGRPREDVAVETRRCEKRASPSTEKKRHVRRARGGERAIEDKAPFKKKTGGSHTAQTSLRGSAAPVRSREGPPHAHARSENTLPAADKRGPRFRDDRAERGAPPLAPPTTRCAMEAVVVVTLREECSFGGAAAYPRNLFQPAAVAAGRQPATLAGPSRNDDGARQGARTLLVHQDTTSKKKIIIK